VRREAFERNTAALAGARGEARSAVPMLLHNRGKRCFSVKAGPSTRPFAVSRHAAKKATLWNAPSTDNRPTDSLISEC
jgi:hypothetical protein